MELFTGMPAHAKTWVYVSNRPFSITEQQEIQQTLNIFVQGWTAHELPLKAAAAVVLNQVVVIMVDGSYHEISGCGIDKSVQLMRNLNAQYNVDFFNRMLIHIQHNNQLTTYTKTGLQEAIDKGLESESSLMLNLMVTDKESLRNNLFQPLHQSWIAKQLRFLVQS